MDVSRRNFIIRSIGAAICAGMTPPLITSLLPGRSGHEPVDPRTYRDILEKYLPYELLHEQFVKSDYIMTKLPDSDFGGGLYDIPLVLG